MRLTKNFKLAEVVCKCGCQGHRQHLDAINQSIAVLQIIRIKWMGAIAVNSFYRCPYHNVRVGGVPGSYHISGKAFDIRPTGGSFMEFLRFMRGLESDELAGCIWIKEYSTFVHVDIRGLY